MEEKRKTPEEILEEAKNDPKLQKLYKLNVGPQVIQNTIQKQLGDVDIKIKGEVKNDTVCFTVSVESEKTKDEIEAIIREDHPEFFSDIFFVVGVTIPTSTEDTLPEDPQ